MTDAAKPNIRCSLKEMIDKARTPEFMARLRRSMERNKPILDRLAAEKIDHIPSHSSPPEDGFSYITIDRSPYRVAVGDYTGRQVREFVHPPVHDDYDLWREVPGDNDELVEDQAIVPIHVSGLRFFSTRRFINAG